jgi:hypothetical protein
MDSRRKLAHIVYRDSQKNIHLRQAVSLTGLGTEKFERSIDAIIHIHTLFSRTFKDGLLDPWLLSAFKDHNAIDISNRYFTSRRQSPNAVQLPFHNLVDPDRILEGMVDGDIVHSEENDVQYFELDTKNGDTKEKCVHIKKTNQGTNLMNYPGTLGLILQSSGSATMLRCKCHLWASR